MTNILQRKFFEQDTLLVARSLLGCFLVRRIGKKIWRARIVETEGYVGEDDLACHASKGRTKRTETMYGKAGRTYIYLVYGMYELLNIVTEKENLPAAVLIRAVTIEDESTTKTNGPGKLTRYLHITRRLNSHDVTRGERLWVERGRAKKGERAITTERIGVAYAKHCAAYPWRFVLADESVTENSRRQKRTRN